jgi:hypothetical protein
VGTTKGRDEAPEQRAADVAAGEKHPGTRSGDQSAVFSVEPDHRLGQQDAPPIIKLLY